MKYLLSLVLSIIVMSASWSVTSADSEEITMEAVVSWIVEDRHITVLDKQQPYQKLKLLVTSGPEKGQEVVYEHGLLPMTSIQTYAKGDKIILGKSTADSGESSYYILDVVRRPSLYLLTAIFVVLVIVVARFRAVRSLLALVVSFGVIFGLILPRILSGSDPVIIALIGSLFIMPVTFYLSHGWNKKTHVAIAGTLAALVVTGLLARVFVEGTRLTGFSSEEATFLQAMKGSTINVQGLLLAGIIIGILGILDDVTVSQAAIVKELVEANQSLKGMDLFQKAMRVGTDHIASMINTLVLVYAGASMPLLLLFLDTPKPFQEIINYEIVAEEIVRTLVGSIGLVLAVPITTFLAVRFFAKR